MEIKSRNLIFFLLLMIITMKSVTNISLKSKNIKENLIQIKQLNKNSTNNETTEDNNSYYANGTCSSSNCYSPYGICISNSSCLCNIGYAQDPSKEVNKTNISCDYKLKEQQLFFLWIGAGHFYAQRWLYASAKCATIILIIIFDCFIKQCFFTNQYSNNFKGNRPFNIFIYFLYFLIFFWECFDLIMIALNKFSDGKGMDISVWEYA